MAFSSRPSPRLRISLDGLLIQAESQAAHHLQVARMAAGIHFHVQHDRALILGFTGFFGVLRFGPEERNGRRDAAAHAENTAAKTAAFAGTESWAFARADAAAGTGTD